MLYFERVLACRLLTPEDLGVRKQFWLIDVRPSIPLAPSAH